MKELAYLKIQPRDQEENRLTLLRAERLYEESLGDNRKGIELYIRKFEEAMKKGSREEIEAARKELNMILDKF